MILSLVCIIVGVVGYWHRLQGFFSATISAILTVLAAVFAIGWHEKVTDMLLKGRFADEAYAITLVAIFVLVYTIGRFTFDKLVPGNLRFPALVDQIGGGAMGLIAGIACAGVALIAIQTLPFSESILGWSRYEVVEKTAAIVRESSSQQVDAVFTELNADKFLNDKADAPLVPADEWMLGLVSLLSSENGSLSNGRAWAAVHPNLLQELFGQRVAMLPGARHCALAEKISVDDISTLGIIAQKDQERYLSAQGVSIGTRGKRPAGELKNLELVRKAGPGNVLLRVAVSLDADNRDLKSSVVTFPAAAVRLCVPVSGEPGGRLAVNCFPIGTMELGDYLFVTQPDDMLFAQPNKLVDFVFEVPAAAVQKGNRGVNTMVAGSFLEFKRLAREELGGHTVYDNVRKLRESGILRKEGVLTKVGGSDTTSTSTPGTNTPRTSTPAGLNPNVPLAIVDNSVTTNGQLPSGINVGTPNQKIKDEIAAWGSFSLDEGKFVDIELTAVQTVQLMAKGANIVNTLGAPQGKRAIIVWTRTREDIPDKWAWANNLNDFAYTDGGGTRYPLAGVIVKLKNANGQDMLNLTFNSTKQNPVKYAPDKDALQMRPSEVGLIFVVPQGAQMTNLMFKTEVAKNLPANVN